MTPCSTTRVGVRPASQHRSLKCVTCTRVSSGRSAIGCLVTGTSPAGRVVLQVHGGQVGPGVPPQPPPDQLLLVRALQDHHVDVLVAQPFR